MERADVYEELVEPGEMLLGGIRVMVIIDDNGDEQVRFERDGDLRIGTCIYALEVTKLMIYEAGGDTEVKRGDD